MSDMLDKNGNPLKGGAVWLRTISNAGGLDEYNKKVAKDIFSQFVDSHPVVASALVEDEARKKRRKLKLIRGKK